jgi:class 3 adenylate cyclase
MQPGREPESAHEHGAVAPTERPCEIAFVLFTDIVGYSTLTIDRQAQLLTGLQQIVKGSSEWQQARAKDVVITLPTGDGMALVFFSDPVAPVRCAVEIAGALRALPEMRLRMGIHSGPVWRHADIKDELNVVGGGINMAQRVMDCGDAGHILLSASVADVLLQLGAWRNSVHELGIFEVKHGVRIPIYNLYRAGVGNPEPPRKQPFRPEKPRARSKIAAVVLAALLACAAYVALRPSERSLSYYVMLQKPLAGSPFRVNGARVFEPGYRIRFFFTSPETGYLYILNEGPESKPESRVFNTLFPSPLNNGGSAELSPGKELPIPQGGPMVFDSERGEETLWLVWSKTKLPELEALERWLNPKDQGAIGDRSQLDQVTAFLQQHAGSALEAKEEAACQCTVLRGRGDILVSALKLYHD